MREPALRCSSLFSACLAATAGAQNFANFETPAIDAMAVATAGGTTYVVACNPRDDSIVVTEADDSTRWWRIAVGQGPASVHFHPPTQRLYTANHLGDSVSVLAFDSTPEAPPWRLMATQPVGDEPTDLSVREDATNGPSLWVLLGSRSEIARLDPVTLAALPALGSELFLPVFNSDGIVMKYPYRLVHRPNGDALILNHRAGSNPALPEPSPPPKSVDFDLLQWDHATGLVSVEGAVVSGNSNAGTLGTSNMGMALAADGRVFVVGNKARNDIVGEPALKTAATGFVESHLWIVPNPLAVTGIEDRNLNLAGNGQLVGSNSRVSMPTDVALQESGATLVRVFVPSFSTDRIVVLTPNAGTVDTWSSATTSVAARSGYVLAGPRSLALTTVGGVTRLHVLCTLDASIHVYTVGTSGTLTEILPSVPLSDPMPSTLRSGQVFLYDARTQSLNGMVSCASCHIDGKTDGLAWRLDQPQDPSPGDVPERLRDGIAFSDPDPMPYPCDRGPMVTQTLQGLVTAPSTSSGDLGGLLSTEPFYWRGRRLDFAAFAGGFTNLLGRGNAPSAYEMGRFEEYVFTIQYPPNPEQPLDRVYDGSIGPVFAPPRTRQLSSGSGALRGLKLFHTMPLQGENSFFEIPLGVLTAGRSCVQCHALPAGTNGRITVREGDGQPLKTAQTRGIRARESVFRPYTPWPIGGTPYPPTGTFSSLFAGVDVTPHGFLHRGDADSLDNFENTGFKPILPESGVTQAVMDDLVRFIRQFDTGVAPIVGQAFTVTAANQAGWPGGSAAMAMLMQTQVERGNCGLVVIRRVGGNREHYFYDVTPPNPAAPQFVNLPPAGSTAAPPQPKVTAAQPNGLVPAVLAGDDMVVFQCVPPAAERRIGDPSGQLVPVARPNPTLTSVRLVVPDPWKPIVDLDQNLLAAPGTTPVAHQPDMPGDLQWESTWGGSPSPLPTSIQARQQFFAVLSAAGAVPARRHEPPRRFRVIGSDIFAGATLRITFPASWTGTTPVFNGASASVTFPLVPVRLANDSVVWETSATISPDIAMALLLGGFTAPGVQSTWDTGKPTPAGSLSTVYNQFRFTVVNETGTYGTTLQAGLSLLDP